MRGLAAALAILSCSGIAMAEPRVNEQRVVLRTNHGDLVLALYPDVAPKHVEQIVRLVRMGLYDGTPILRVQAGFVVQLSVVENRREVLKPEESEAIHPLPLELDPALQHHAGVLSMAHGDDPDSARTSFAIMLGDAPELDGHFTIFGRVERGMEVVDAISKVPVDFRHVPLDPVEVQKAQLATPKELEKMVLNGPVRSQAAGIPSHAIAALLVVIGLALALALSAGRAPPRLVAALGLLIVLVAFLALYAGLMPYARGSRWLSAALFFGAIGVFRLMGRFENPS